MNRISHAVVFSKVLTSFFVAVLCMAATAVSCIFCTYQASALDTTLEYESAFPSISLMGYKSISYPGGGSYEGDLNADLEKSGKGTYTWDNGDSYTGKWRDDMMHGKGVYRFANGATLKGTFKEDTFISGTYKAKVKKNSFKVLVKKENPYKAIIKIAKKFKYKGGFRNGKFNGKGSLTYSSGAKYKGSYVNGKRFGKGTYTWKSGAKYKGSWKRDAMNGKGTYFYSAKSKAKYLRGKFSRNKPKGTCSYKLKSGAIYKTVWKNGKCVKVK